MDKQAAITSVVGGGLWLSGCVHLTGPAQQGGGVHLWWVICGEGRLLWAGMGVVSFLLDLSRLGGAGVRDVARVPYFRCFHQTTSPSSSFYPSFPHSLLPSLSIATWGEVEARLAALPGRVGQILWARQWPLLPSSCVPPPPSAQMGSGGRHSICSPQTHTSPVPSSPSLSLP